MYLSKTVYFVISAERVREENLKLVCIPTSFQVGTFLMSIFSHDQGSHATLS